MIDERLRGDVNYQITFSLAFVRYSTITEQQAGILRQACAISDQLQAPVYVVHDYRGNDEWSIDLANDSPHPFDVHEGATVCKVEAIKGVDA